MGTKPRHALKDSVFKNLFGDKKYLLQLYKALHPEDKEATEDDIRDVTIKPVFMDSEYNDLGFSVGDRLIALVESQSTWSANIIIRALMYLINTYHDYFARTEQNLYSSKKVKMPVPELYVVYTGNRKSVPSSISLGEEFFGGRKCAIDAEVKILSDGREKNIIGEYIAFCRVYDEQRNLYGRTDRAIREAIRICRDKDILREYLKEHEREVIDMMMTLFDDEHLSRAYEAELERQYEAKLKTAVDEYARKAEIERQKATEIERQKTAEKTALNIERKTAEKMIAAGSFTLEQIAEYSGLSVEEVGKLAGAEKPAN